MRYRIARNGSELGEASEEEIRSGLASGQYVPGDLAWREGMNTWQMLGELFPADSASAPIRTHPPVVRSTSSSPSMSVASSTSGLAIASLITGILGFVSCGTTGLVGIICGHMALAKIRISGGAVGGRGMALAGLITGYLSLVLAVVSVIGALAVPTFSRIQERASITKSISNGKQLIVACRMYASDHEGRFPDNLELLETESIMEAGVVEKLNRTPGTSDPAFEYLGKGVKESDDGRTVVLRGLTEYTGGKRIIGRADSSVELVTDSP